MVLAHLSDSHVMDHQSPARAELFDRYSDLDSPLRAEVGIIGCYRAQELFTYQVAESMVRAIRAVERAPVSGAPIDFAIVTGDATDNCQLNELRAYIDLLDGQRVLPDSGDLSQLRGRGRAERRRRAVLASGRWRRGPAPGRYTGSPRCPGRLDAARRPFQAAGLGLPWYAVHGNHDNMMQGTVPATGLAAGLPGRRRSSTSRRPMTSMRPRRWPDSKRPTPRRCSS